ncbi:Demethylmenaquinone methyltransferase [Bosea sp. TND4EK4]|nr:Demethylmenaquinone methyltransferase [Bosea sp. TND4EK4]
MMPKDPAAEIKPATTLELCAMFGPYARVLPPLFDYTAAKTFVGPASILKVSGGRERLNLALLKHCADHVVIIDGRHLAPFGIVGPTEVASAVTGKCRALLVFGSVFDVGKLAKEKILPVHALDNGPHVLRDEGGKVEAAYLDCAAGLITHDFYITGDADGIVAVRQEQMQAHFPVR